MKDISTCVGGIMNDLQQYHSDKKRITELKNKLAEANIEIKSLKVVALNKTRTIKAQSKRNSELTKELEMKRKEVLKLKSEAFKQSN